MSTLKQQPEYLYYVGSTFTVEWYFDSSGWMEAKEYYERLSHEEQKRLADLVAYFADNPIGTRLPKSLYNEEDSENKIYDFKPRDHRFFNFMTSDRKIIILSAYLKHSQQMSKKDLNLLKTAIAAKHDYLSRVNAGSYYERNA